MEVARISDVATRRQIQDLQTKIVQVQPGPLPTQPSDIPQCDHLNYLGLQGGSSVEALRKELSDILTRDCPACGELLVDTIDKPFDDVGGMSLD